MNKISFKNIGFLKLIIGFFIFILMIYDIPAQTSLINLSKINKPNFFDIQKAFNAYFDSIPPSKRRGWKQFKRWEWFCQSRVDSNGNFPNPKVFIDAINQYMQKYSKNNKQNNLLSNDIQWSSLGPSVEPVMTSNYGINHGIGRVNVVRFNPTDDNEVWVGSASGGVWRSTDHGLTWSDFPFTEFLSLGVGDIEISKSNPNIVYVATGDIETSADFPFYSIGLIKTTDAGATWNITNFAYTQDQGIRIGRIIINPTDPNNVVIATSSGIYKTTDGGTTWTLKLSGNFRDLKSKPDDPTIIYGATFGWGGTNYIYKSSDAGETWKKVSTYTNCIRIALAVTPANSSNVYALCVNSSRAFLSFNMSFDAGDTWEVITTPDLSGNILGYNPNGSDLTAGQGEYDLAMAVSPNDENLIYTGGVNIWVTTDQGSDWELNADWAADQAPYVHADIHDLQFDNSSNTLFVTCDGGIDYLNSQNVWTDITNGLSIRQFYKLSSSEKSPYLITGGSQDNGTAKLSKGIWTHIYSGDGMVTRISPNDSNTIYVENPYGTPIARSSDGGISYTTIIYPSKNINNGENGAWVTPFILYPPTPSFIFAGYTNVWKSTNSGSNWTKITNFTSGTILSLAISPIDSNYIYAATSNNLYGTTNGGTSWTNLYSSSNQISYITVDPQNPRRIWITLSGFSAGNKVMEYDGTQWINLSGNLPNVPVDCITYQKNSPDRLYVGTDIGAFYEDYESSQWVAFGSNLPNVLINELEINYSINKIRAATFGRGIWEADLINCNQPAITVNINGPTTFCQGDSVILQAPSGYSSYTWSNGKTSQNISVTQSGNYSAAVQNPDGCVIRSKAINVNVNAIPNLVISSRGKSCLCGDDSVVLTASTGFQKYSWSTGDSVRQITIRQPGSYIVSGVTSDTCPSTSIPYSVVRNNIPDKPVITVGHNVLISTPSYSYQWYQNGLIIAGATSQTFVATGTSQSGTYFVKIKDSNSCPNVSDPVSFTYDYVQETLTGDQYFKISPNPSTGIFIVDLKLEQPENISMIVTSSLGTEVYKSVLSYNGDVQNYTLDLSAYSAGVYFVRLQFGGRELFTKIVKE